MWQACNHRDVLSCVTAYVLQDGIPTSLLKLSSDNMGRAVKMFGGIQKYMGADGPEGVTAEQRIEIASKLLHQAIRRPELKDELYMQVCTASSPLVAKYSGRRAIAVQESYSRLYQLSIIYRPQ